MSAEGYAKHLKVRERKNIFWRTGDPPSFLVHELIFLYGQTVTNQFFNHNFSSKHITIMDPKINHFAVVLIL